MYNWTIKENDYNILQAYPKIWVLFFRLNDFAAPSSSSSLLYFCLSLLNLVSELIWLVWQCTDCPGIITAVLLHFRRESRRWFYTEVQVKRSTTSADGKCGGSRETERVGGLKLAIILIGWSSCELGQSEDRWKEPFFHFFVFTYRMLSGEDVSWFLSPSGSRASWK